MEKVGCKSFQHKQMCKIANMFPFSFVQAVLKAILR
jgi:hypothetical protein